MAYLELSLLLLSILMCGRKHPSSCYLVVLKVKKEMKDSDRHKLIFSGRDCATILPVVNMCIVECHSSVVDFINILQHSTTTKLDPIRTA